MPIDFPTGPATGQVYSYQGNSWVYNGTAWDTVTPAFGDAFLPAGSIIQWSASAAPTNWLICDGAAVSRNTFSSLFAAIGTLYGAGNGTTTFNLPDLRGRVAVGLDSTQTEFDTLGESGGAKTHTLTIAEMPSHSHTTSGNPGIYRDFTGAGSNHGTLSINPSTLNFANPYSTNAVGGGGAHNNLQPYEVLHYIIKASAGTTAGDSELATRLGAAEAAVGQRALSSNAIINGAFDIWQRGTSFTNVSNLVHTADRWNNALITSASSLNITKVTGPTGDLPNAIRCVQTTSQASVTNYASRQTIERSNVEPLAGKPVVLSFWYRSNKVGVHGARLIGSINTTGGTDLDLPFTVATANTWQRYSLVFSSFSGVTAFTTAENTLAGIVDIGFRTSTQGFTTLAANDYYELTGVQLEAGAVATPFKRNAPSIQGELAACQRYYEKSYNPEVAPGTNTNNGSLYQGVSSDMYGSATYTINFQVTKRVTPSLAVWSNPGVAGVWTYHRSGVGDTNAGVNWTGGWPGANGGMAYLGVGASHVPCTITGQWAANAEF
jgi:microcystin-dependent protein